MIAGKQRIASSGVCRRPFHSAAVTRCGAVEGCPTKLWLGFNRHQDLDY